MSYNNIDADLTYEEYLYLTSQAHTAMRDFYAIVHNRIEHPGPELPQTARNPGCYLEYVALVLYYYLPDHVFEEQYANYHEWLHFHRQVLQSMWAESELRRINGQMDYMLHCDGDDDIYESKHGKRNAENKRFRQHLEEDHLARHHYGLELEKIRREQERLSAEQKKNHEDMSADLSKCGKVHGEDTSKKSAEENLAQQFETLLRGDEQRGEHSTQRSAADTRADREVRHGQFRRRTQELHDRHPLDQFRTSKNNRHRAYPLRDSQSKPTSDPKAQFNIAADLFAEHAAKKKEFGEWRAMFAEPQGQAYHTEGTEGIDEELAPSLPWSDSHCPDCAKKTAEPTAGPSGTQVKRSKPKQSEPKQLKPKRLPNDEIHEYVANSPPLSGRSWVDV
jgi:hypothetical protein